MFDLSNNSIIGNHRQLAINIIPIIHKAELKSLDDRVDRSPSDEFLVGIFASSLGPAIL